MDNPSATSTNTDAEQQRPEKPDAEQECRETRDAEHRLKYFDTCNWFSFVFIAWSRSWMNYFCKSFIEPDDIHPLPKVDSVDLWQPIFAKHVSDGLLRLERWESASASEPGKPKALRPYRSIILRALFLTFWRCVVVLLLAHIALNLVNVGTAILLKRLMGYMNDKERSMKAIIGMILIIVAVEFVHSVIGQHVFLYFHRVHVKMEAAITITLFQHGMCHRRAYASSVDRLPEMSSCKGVVHSWPCKDNECASNPLLCPARRYQNRELPPNIYVYLFVDAYAIVCIVNAMIDIVKFVSVFVFSIYLIGSRIQINVLVPASIVLTIVFILILIEAINGYVWYHTLQSKDNRVARTAEALGHLNVLRVMGVEDVGYNMVRHSRQDEMMLLKTRISLHAVSVFLNRIIGVSVLLYILLDYIKTLKTSIHESTFDISAPITIMFIVEKIASASENLPKTMKTVVEAATSLTRVEWFIRSCSPNYYLNTYKEATAYLKSQSNKWTQADLQDELPSDTVAQFKDASFAWYYDRKELLSVNKASNPFFAKINFELKGGEIKIITGNQGCGKTSFIKAMLGEMSLVSGSMAVAPLSTGMPIFYTSQEVWLPSGSIRSIITFGYAFDEDIYKRVTSAVELESDFASWEDGDMRVISAKGYSLSGGQRVRLSLARALYAYLVFSKANERLEDRCRFLMCLDEPFNGLDSKVTASIAANLFKKGTGLLVRDDVSVVMAMSKMNLGICLSSVDSSIMADIAVLMIEDGCLSDERGFQALSTEGLPRDTSPTASLGTRVVRKHSSLFRIPDGVWRSCEDGALNMRKENYHLSRRLKALATNYTNDMASQGDLCATKEGYLTLFRAMGLILCFTILSFAFSSAVVDKVNAIWVAKWSDSVKALGGTDRTTLTDPAAIVKEHDHTSVLITTFSSSYIGLIFFAIALIAVANVVGANRLHDFALNSMFTKSSSVITLKKSVGELCTFLASDMSYIDIHLVSLGQHAVFGFLKLLLQFATVCYTIPISIPVPLIGGAIIYFGLLQKYLVASKKGQLLMLEGVTNINAVYASVIDGSAVYRSYQKEKQCIKSIYERSDYYYRSKFIKAAFTARFMIETKLMTCLMLLIVALLPVLYSYITGKPLQVAQVGLGISVTMAINSALTSFILYYASMDKSMCSMSRYNRFFLQGRFSLNEKFESMNETVLRKVGDKDDWNKERCAGLLKRRRNEFRDFIFRRYRSVLSSLFYKPRVEFLDCGEYLCGEHVSLELENVSVPQQATTKGESSHYILKGVTASTRAGDVVGIVGRTGAGKSTLLSVLQNIASKREGSVLLDGRELNTIPRKVLRHIIGVLPQMPFVFKGWTLRRFLDPRMLHSDDEIMHALECCGLMDLVQSLPGTDPLDAVLAPTASILKGGHYLITPLIKIKGAKNTGFVLQASLEDKPNDTSASKSFFSSTQMRMLSFARLILYRDLYRVLLVDEPPADENSNEGGSETTNQDESRSGAAAPPVYDLVRMYFKHCTTFIVAHDKNVLKYCNRLFEMCGGELVTNKVLEPGDIEKYFE
ncbi:ABC transporter family protein [Babesia ovata]|uniref:ABC transporter family protein n=1 Tax=Babesia ovata TaxID=189622 RepID=A0A2H6K7T4_9APIC|nr:ABC transporter family protein [Babesia ovata]GBE59056.1 ABC transporter family protein [Babesia ovata]